MNSSCRLLAGAFTILPASRLTRIGYDRSHHRDPIDAAAVGGLFGWARTAAGRLGGWLNAVAPARFAAGEYQAGATSGQPEPTDRGLETASDARLLSYLRLRNSVNTVASRIYAAGRSALLGTDAPHEEWPRPAESNWRPHPYRRCAGGSRRRAAPHVPTLPRRWEAPSWGEARSRVEQFLANFWHGELIGQYGTDRQRAS
jgi:hypothetical protein